ncbi:prenyltransferase/squalene oxidase repeat-containing protein [Streptomyces sp. SAJ15]|uniref:prenyltransferase/squalene oxidase repeat-containing protein n=1 Tax=Streptomyces sp. SAJ15 TaxID=2011095 RepID=UPI00118574D8|nr:prenyltransferase/squalene oxidase repeat-containing protein [Streptomyces sp. SAJ15]TVL87826.1 hypothetical protein CD790_32605 [Streptomyces sp. SAJ15]
MTTGVDLILLAPEGDRVVLRAEGSRLVCLRLELAGLPDDTGRRPDDGIDTLVERTAAREFGVDVAFMGLLAYEHTGGTGRLVAAAVLRPERLAMPHDARWRTLSVAEVCNRGADIEHAAHLVTAVRWHRAASGAAELSTAIRRAFDTSIAYLDSHLSTEDGRWGWNQWQDGRSIGILSTAEAVLAHIHAGARGEFVSRPAQTLAAEQNPDGGWRVRSSLIGGMSSLSITESTAACLTALREAGWSHTDSAVTKGIAWLEEQQRPDGGWASSAEDSQSMVFPTTAAIRALAGFNRVDSVSRGVSWLRHAQCPDGGWGASPRATDSARPSSPAYTGYAIVALLAARSPETDTAVVAGCDYLVETFDALREEPWESTTANTPVDPGRSIRMDYRHFATPWALTALSLAGHDLDEAVVLDGVRRLLALQQPNGTWRCSVTAPDSPPVWATHDAVLALRTVLRASTRTLVPVAVDQYVQQDRRVMQAHLGRVVAQPSDGAAAGGRIGRVGAVWLSALTVAVTMLGLWQGGVFEQLQSSSGTRQVLAAAASIVLPVAGATVPAVLIEEHRLRRGRRSANRRQDGD